MVIVLVVWAIWAIVTIFSIQASMPVTDTEPLEEVITERLEKEVSSEEKISDSGNQLIGMGEFKITFYADCPQDQGKWVGQTSTGAKPTVGRTIAVDPKVIPYGTIVWVDADDDGILERYVAEDCGGGIKNKEIDVLVASYEEGCRRGVLHKNVYVEKGD